MSIFGELLRISGFRESKAETEVARARTEVARAHGVEDDARKRLAEFEAFAERRERELYEELCRRIVKLREIEEVQLGVLELREGERRHAAQVEAARRALAEAVGALDAAREVHRLAVRLNEKYFELANSYEEERQREVQRIEDLEMEEVHRVTLDREEREEWEQSHGDMA